MEKLAQPVDKTPESTRTRENPASALLPGTRIGGDHVNVDANPSQPRFAFGLTPPEVERFRDIMRRECDVELTEAEAWGRAIQLIALFRMLLGPLPEDPGATEFEHRSS